MSTMCQPGVTSAPLAGSVTLWKPSVEATNTDEEFGPLCQETPLFPVSGEASTASSSPSTGQVAWLVSQNDVQLAMVVGFPGSAGKSMSASITADEKGPG